jgi:hypothetical protein
VPLVDKSWILVALAQLSVRLIAVARLSLRRRRVWDALRPRFPTMRCTAPRSTVLPIRLMARPVSPLPLLPRLLQSSAPA